MNADPLAPLDGNAAAGLLSEIFAFEATSAVFVCDGCGAEGQFGGAKLFGGAMGVVLRCAHCEAVVLRASRTPAGIWVDMHGARTVLAPTPT